MKTNKNGVKLLAALMVFAMAIVGFTIVDDDGVDAATDPVEVSNETSLIEAVKTGNNVVLKGNITLTKALDLDGITVDAGKFTISTGEFKLSNGTILAIGGDDKNGITLDVGKEIESINIIVSANETSKYYPWAVNCGLENATTITGCNISSSDGKVFGAIHVNGESKITIINTTVGTGIIQFKENTTMELKNCGNVVMQFGLFGGESGDIKITNNNLIVDDNTTIVKSIIGWDTSTTAGAKYMDNINLIVEGKNFKLGEVVEANGNKTPNTNKLIVNGSCYAYGGTNLTLEIKEASQLIVPSEKTYTVYGASSNAGTLSVDGTLAFDDKATLANSSGALYIYQATENTNALDLNGLISGKKVTNTATIGGDGWSFQNGTLILTNYNGKQFFDGAISTVTVNGASTITVVDSVADDSFAAIKSNEALTISGDKLTIKVTLDKAAASNANNSPSDFKHSAIYSSNDVTVETDLEITIDGEIVKAGSNTPSEAVYAVFGKNVTLGDEMGAKDITVNVDVLGNEDYEKSLACVLSFAVRSTADMSLYNVDGIITGGDRALQAGSGTITISGCDLTLIGGEKAIQAKNDKNKVVIQGYSNITLKLLTVNESKEWNGGEDDRYGIKTVDLAIESGSIVISEGLRLYSEDAKLINSGILIINGGYAQKAQYVAGFVSDSTQIGAYDGIATETKDGNIYVGKNVETKNVLLMPLPGGSTPIEGEVVASEDEANEILKEEGITEVTIIGNADLSKIDAKEGDTVVISGTATISGELQTGVNFVVSDLDKDITVDGAKLAVNGGSIDATISVSEDSITIKGTVSGMELTVNKKDKGFNFEEGSILNGVTVSYGAVDATISMTVKTGSVAIVMGSIMIDGSVTTSASEIDLATDIGAEDSLAEITLKNIKITTSNTEGITIQNASKIKIIGTVEIGAGVTIKACNEFIMDSNAKIIGSGTVDLKDADTITFGTGSSISTTTKPFMPAVLEVKNASDFSAENLALFDKFVISVDTLPIDGVNISIPAGKIINLNGKTLQIRSAGSFKITDSKIIDSSEDGDGLVDVLGTFTINNSDVLADVYVHENASIVIEKAKSQTITGQSVDSTAVGYGNTLVLDGVTIEYGNTVTAYGNLVIKGTTKIVNGGSLVIGTYGNAKISGTMNVAGSVEAYGAVTIDGTVNVSGSKDKFASFSAFAIGDMDEMVNITKDGVLNIAKPSGNTYTNTLYGAIVVKGTLNMNGTFTGVALDYGTVKINGTVGNITYHDDNTGRDVTIPSIVLIMDGVQVDVTSLYGQIAVTDYFAVYDLIDGMDENSYKYTAGNIITLKNVKGVSVSTAVSTAVNKTGTLKYFYADMTVSGTASKTDKNLDADFSITLAGSTNSCYRNNVTSEPIGPTSTTSRFAQIYISETLNIGTGVDMIVDRGTVIVDGNLNAVEEDSTITVDAGATLTVNGLVTIGGKNNDYSGPIVNNGTIKAATYTILDPVDFYRTYYYTTADAAIDKIADAEDKTVTVLGKITLSTSKTIASEQTIIVNGGAKLTIGSKAVLEAAKGSVIENNGAISVSGSFIIENYDADFSGTEPSADVVTKDDVKRTYTSLKGAIESGATTIVLKQNVTLYSDLTIPEGVLVTTEANDVSITVSVNYTLTVEGGLELPTGSVFLNEAALGSSDNDAELIITGHFLYSTAFSLNDIDGAHFAKKVNGKYQNIISNVEYAAANVDDTVQDQTVYIIGEVSASDVTFTKGKNDLTIQVDGDAVFSVKSMKLVGVSLVINGKMSGSVIASTGLQSTDTGATTDGVIDLENAKGIVISSKTVEAATGITDYMYISGTLHGVATVSAGTVTIDTTNLTIEDETVDSKFTVTEGATVSVSGADLIVSTSNNGKANLIIDGKVIVSGNGNKLTVTGTGVASVSGTIEVIEKGTVDVTGTIYITGTVDVSADKGKEGNFDATGIVVLGEKPTILGQAGAAAKIDGKIELGTSGYIKAYPGADLTTTKINWQDGTNESSAFSTSLVINDVTYMTVYTQKSNLLISYLIDNEEFELVGLFNGVNFNVDSQDTGLYNKGSWYTDAAMSPNKKIVVNTTKVSKDLEAVYAFADAADVYGVISVGTGLNLFIDGVPVQSGPDAKLGVGTHTVRFDVFANYDGSKAVLSFNGQVISNGSTITIGAGDKTFSLMASGAVPSESEIIVTPGEPSQPGKDDGMGLTDILLIVLVVLAAILVIVVAIRMMRS